MLDLKRDPVTVWFDGEAMQAILRLADRRLAVKEANRVRDRKLQATRSAFDVTLVGCLGECAAAQVLRVRADRSLCIGADDGYDLLFRGATVQVKTNGRQSGTDCIVATLKTLDRAALLVACRLRSAAAVDVVGWCTREQYVERARREDFGYGLHYCVPFVLLDPLATLLESPPLAGLEGGVCRVDERSPLRDLPPPPPRRELEQIEIEIVEYAIADERAHPPPEYFSTREPRDHDDEK